MSFSTTPEYRRAYAKAYRVRNRAKIIARDAAWRQEYGNETLAARAREKRRSDVPGYLLKQARKNAKAHGHDFNLDIEDIIVPEVCPVFGVPLVMGGPDRNAAPSIDRIRNELGYVKGNVVIVSFRANSAKKDLSLAELRQLVSFYEQVF